MRPDQDREKLANNEAVDAARRMLGSSPYPATAGLVVLCLLFSVSPATAQCTVSEIIEQMATSTEALEFAPAEGPETLGLPTENGEEETPTFVFTPEIRPDQRALLLRVGQTCAWMSDVSNCTFRRVARMALRGRDATFIYDRCSD